jgi:ATP-binding cassette, subfamily B, bacterial PglK
VIREVLALLDKGERHRLSILLPLVMGSAVFETLGVASISPFLALVGDRALVQTSPAFRWLFGASGVTRTETFVALIGIGLACFVVLANLLNMLATWGVLRFVWGRNHSIALRLLRSYLSEPYVYYLQRNTSEMVVNLISEVQQAVSNVLQPAMEIVSEGFLSLLLLAVLVAVDPALALGAAFTLGVVYATMYVLVRRKVKELGKRRIDANRERFRIASEAFGGIKELKLLGREEAFLRRYARSSLAFSRASAAQQVIGRLPRNAILAFAYSGLVFFFLYVLSTKGDVRVLLPTLGLYAVAGARLLPSLQQVFQGATTIRFGLPALRFVLADLKNTSEHAIDLSRSPGVEAAPFKDRIAFTKVHFRYPGAKTDLFLGLDLEISARSIVGIVGETGSGKTTLVDLLLGLLAPEGGSIEIDGALLGPDLVRGWQSQVGYVPQQIFLADDTVTRNIAFALPDDEIDQLRVERAAKLAQIHSFVVESLPKGYDTEIGERGVRLSGGQRQRLGIARSLYGQPSLLVFDEATSALDGLTEDAVLHAVQALAGSTTIVIIAHRITSVQACDRIFVLHNGSIEAAGSYDELLETSERFRAMAKVG